MIGGANYTDSVVCSHAQHLQRFGDFRCSALRVDGGLGHPGQFDASIFEDVFQFPMIEHAPRTMGQNVRLGCDLMLAAIPSSLRWGDRSVITPSKDSPLRTQISHRVMLERYARALSPQIGEYDVCQWHCFEPQRLPALAFFPPEAKIVLTIWGSDLLRTNGANAYRIQLEACERATRIVVHCVEMREIFLAKFGRHFADKMRFATVGCDLFDEIDRVRAQSDAVSLPVTLPEDKVVVCVGTNGDPVNRHLDIMASLAELDATVRDRVIVVFPMTYGGSPSYFAEIKDAAVKAGVEYRLLTHRVSAQEIAQLRCSTDIMIHMPVSDAFSAAVAETVYGGGVLIAGAWLPYGFLRRRGIHFHEIEDYSEVSRSLGFVVDNLQEEKEKAAKGATVMKELKAWSHVIPQWAQLYEELL
jgi:hypothetical protein